MSDTAADSRGDVSARTSDRPHIRRQRPEDWLAPAAVIGAALLVAGALAAGYWAGSGASDEPTSDQRAGAFLRCLTANGVSDANALFGSHGDVVSEPGPVLETDRATRRRAMSACDWMAPELARRLLGADLVATHADPRPAPPDRDEPEREQLGAACRRLAQSAIRPDDPAYDMLRRLCRSELD